MGVIKQFQNNFTTGVISPGVRNRVDLAKYDGACQKIVNGIVRVHGGISKRPGTKYIETAGNGRLIPFVYNTEQTYALLFLDGKLRIYTDGGRVARVNGTALEINSPYALAGLPRLTYAQSADVMFLAHPSYPPKKLSRYGHADWRFEDVAFMPSIEAPGTVAVSVEGFTDSTNTYAAALTQYKAAAVNANEEESIPSDSVVADTLSTWPTGARVRVSWDAVPGAVRYEVYKNQHGWYEWVGSSETTSFLDDNIEPDSSVGPKENRDPFHAPVYSGTVSVSGGSVTQGSEPAQCPQIRVSAVNAGGAESIASAVISGSTTTSNEVVSFTPVNGAEYYKIYFRRYASGAYTEWHYIVANSDQDVSAGMDVNDQGTGTTKAAYYVRDTAKDTASAKAWRLVETAFGSHAGYLYSASETPGTGDTLYTNRGMTDTANEKRITLYTSGGTVTLPASNSSTGTPLDAVDCYPGVVGVHQQRLMYGRTNGNPQTVWLSETGAFYSMAVSNPIRDDSAITATVDSKQMNEIRHFAALGDAFILTSGAEFHVEGKDGAITPGTIGFKPQSYWGISIVPPIVQGSTVLMVENSGRVVRDMHFNLSENGYTGDDRTVLAEHLLNSPVVSWAFQQSPYSTIYLCLENGKLLTFTYMREQEIWAWSEHESDGGKFRSVCTVRNGRSDDVYFLVQRGDAYFVERQVLREYGDAVSGAWFVDSGLSYEGTAASVITGLSHLEGKTVCGLADGSEVRGLTVSGGTITLPSAAVKAVIGLPYTMTIQTVDPEIKAENGTTLGMPKTVGRVLFSLRETRGLETGPDENHLERVKFPAPAAWGTPGELYTGMLEVVLAGRTRREASIVIQSSSCLPATILAVVTEVSI